MTRFTMSAFTQMEIKNNKVVKAGPDGAWIGAKGVMLKAATDITSEGKPFILGNIPEAGYSDNRSKDNTNTLFVSYYAGEVKDAKILLMQILDVKQCPWPEPTGKVTHI
jgi:hypothetical protein